MNKNVLNKELGFGIETVLDNLGYTEEKDLFPLDEKMFEGHQFYVPKNYKKWLQVRYGDSYMNLPPEHKRKWHAVKIECDE
jgi:lipopolysaccharide cholinephosphotransferase